jgi:dihydrofolate synthase/folylpolyglutamate synthase
MQWLGQWCLDVGHNPHAAAHLAERLAALPCEGRTIGLLGMLANKDAEGVIDALTPIIDTWVTTRLGGDRGRPADDLSGRLVARGAEVWHGADSPTLAAGWLAPRLAPGDRVLVCGSFFIVAEVLSWLLAHREPSAQTGKEDTASEEVS